MHPLIARPRLLTIEEYLDVGEIEPGYSELVEGRMFLTPTPSVDHQLAATELGSMLRPQLPPELEPILGVDIDMQLAPPDGPGFSRRPDLIVVQRDARQRQRREGGMASASDVVIVAEVLSPGSKRTDRVAKRSEYAEARIPHYWIVDLTGPVSMLVCHLAGEVGYVDDGSPVSGRFTTTKPFPIEIDLDALL